MDTNQLISEVAALYIKAHAARGAGNESEALEHLVKLRELLNAQPELEAGGATKAPAEPSAE